ncbi:hypothetical protein GCM10011380_00540 [Sphingomonas metalli]|uniref:DUF2213 domain-containing protein n=1 Tax=Sphingomonas metalli TaxID=1779358 RepID=A0A916ST19_9SPHN|nr:DUF2213 domain-containing protein [Sphingomonas metalli]GGB15016.1 hypothetical protein GCM10011380_00540 [Sphingomonas metalli]
MFVSDALTLDSPRRTADGYLAVRARASRTGVYQYAGHEVDPDNKHGLRDQASVNVLRDDAAVFDKRAVHSFIGKPITDDHPREAVTAANWRDHSRGAIMGAIRDGDHLAFDLILMDSATIAKVEAGKAELSNGYSASLEFGDFDGPGGVKCQARQASITGNHIAIVDRGRAGPSCRIGDAAICDALPIALEDGAKEAAAWLKKAIALHEKHMNGSAPTTGKEGEKSQMLMMEQMKNALAELEGGGMKSGMKMDCYPFHIHDQEKPVKTMLIDGLTVDMANADTAIATVQTLIAARDAATGKVAGLEKDVAAKDAEIAKLTADNKALADAKPTPAQLRDAAKAFAQVCDKAKALGVTVTDAMDEAAIKKAVVDKGLGATAAAYTADQIAVAFDVLTKDAKVADTQIQSLGTPAVMTDAATAYAADRQKQRRALSDAWRAPFNSADAAAA